MNIPSAIVFVNDDLTPNVKAALVRQLLIRDVMTGIEFNLRVTADPNYPTDIHASNNRILVIRPGNDDTNRSLADVIIFVKAGLASIQRNNFGISYKVYPVDKLTIYQLLNNSSQAISDYVRLRSVPDEEENEEENMGPPVRREIITAINTSYTIKTTDEVIVIRTLSSPITITLPASPVAGDNYSIKDTAGTVKNNNVTVSGNGNNIDGSASALFAMNYFAATFTFTGLEWSIS